MDRRASVLLAVLHRQAAVMVAMATTWAARETMAYRQAVVAAALDLQHTAMGRRVKSY